MARQKGMLNLSGNLEPLAGAPLDSRSITPTVADLYIASNWPYKYIGMKTTVITTGDTYRLVNLDVTQESSWVKEGSGNLSDLNDVDLINLEEGETLVYDGEGGWTNGPAGQTYSDFTGATSQAAGSHGLVPAPTTVDIDKFLKGDGTWATVPMPSFDYSNTSPEANNFSTDEKVIGTWINGKPLYQRTFDEGEEITVEASQWYETSHDASNIDKYVTVSFVTGIGNNTYPGLIITATVGGSGNKVIGLQNCLNRSFKFRYITIRYTKKSDSAVASGEKIVGQWIDGKPIYQKVISNISLDPMPSGSDLSQTNVCSLNGIKIIRDEVYGDNGIERFVLPYMDMTASKIIKSRELRADVMQYVIMHNNSQFDRSGDYRFTAILQYTKTT